MVAASAHRRPLRHALVARFEASPGPRKTVTRGRTEREEGAVRRLACSAIGPAPRRASAAASSAPTTDPQRLSLGETGFLRRGVYKRVGAATRVENAPALSCRAFP